MIMNRADEIHWSVLESRGLAIVSAYGLGHDWRPSVEKVAPMASMGAELRQVTTETQEHPNPMIEINDVDHRVQDLEKSDFAVGRPLAGASTLATDATLEEAGAAA